FIRELAKAFVDCDPVTDPIPVRPTVHYTMGGIHTDGRCATGLAGLYAVGECASVGLHGANRLGSNSLAELLVFGKVAGIDAGTFARQSQRSNATRLTELAEQSLSEALAIKAKQGDENIAELRKELGLTMEAGVGIYRSADSMQATCDKLAQLQLRYQNIGFTDTSNVFNTEWVYAVELGYLLDVGQAMAHSALARTESRGSHQRIDGFETRDDENFLKHTLAYWQAGDAPRLDYQPVTITKSQPAQRLYGAQLDQQEAKP
ncbi:MAG: FAD-binding protein, partial [Reinekea sp.]|nr:FAD-binding protein [Reinekea sp.]